ncbi:hypothetical protein GJW-30_1_04457 [Variibacter gotjawalensis]|uniref:Uncharacterized protein n=1 Tax=Variibacter gotjawalensis TaxID=1333996 RepID=A0A0S3Q124_9BRAD|nr:hypothetical protein [Variibacter gotjawalensis]NIK47742.1 hypothetical protein [Variibacter gotjawalensis]RZS49631.1 hypothetical protein EV661_2069 [Variibacter gotjawalensis]BAT61895.1 hypothetical protein GJW-30_1_04457 [Variibacter gotjawalensis]
MQTYVIVSHDGVGLVSTSLKAKDDATALAMVSRFIGDSVIEVSTDNRILLGKRSLLRATPKLSAAETIAA